jgi:tRNA dimethylallyltransferase
MKRVIVVAGPTASGKTNLAVHIAKKIGGEIISADSMQIYKEMNIGTAKPTVDEMQGIPHYMTGEVSIRTPYSVALYQKNAFLYIDDILSRGKTPIVAGGTGLYINSLLYKLDFTETVRDEKYREELGKLSVDELYMRLSKLDTDAAARIHKNDKKRLIRRLEILKNGGEKGYSFREKNTDYDFCCVGIGMNRKELYQRIELRVDEMVRAGLVEEVRTLYKKYPAELTALKAIGYREIIAYLNGRGTLEDAIEEIKKNTRRFAKRQLTWFNNDDGIKWFSLSEYEDSKALKNAVIRYIMRL